jgi:hypothetical protein
MVRKFIVKIYDTGTLMKAIAVIPRSGFILTVGGGLHSILTQKFQYRRTMQRRIVGQ